MVTQICHGNSKKEKAYLKDGDMYQCFFLLCIDDIGSLITKSISQSSIVTPLFVNGVGNTLETPLNIMFNTSANYSHNKKHVSIFVKVESMAELLYCLTFYRRI